MLCAFCVVNFFSLLFTPPPHPLTPPPPRQYQGKIITFNPVSIKIEWTYWSSVANYNALCLLIYLGRLNTKFTKWQLVHLNLYYDNCTGRLRIELKWNSITTLFLCFLTYYSIKCMYTFNTLLAFTQNK